MRTLIIAITGALALLALAPATAADQTVNITAAGFAPAAVTINAGDTITWRNADAAAHQVRFGKAPCSLNLSAGAGGSCTFRAGGSFSYRDPTQPGTFRGTVTVTGPRTSVTLQSTRRSVPYALALNLSGVISSQATGESVTVSGQDCGKTTFTRVGAATTTAGGNWTLAVKPTINTLFRARWRTTDSTTVQVQVMPAIRLGRVGSRFTVRITAAQAFTGKVVAFQRYRPTLRRWATVKRVTLGAATTPTAGTFVTSARFRARIRRGQRLRVLLPQGQAGTCYLAAPSNVLRVR
jgi:plastocyanin